MRGAGSGRFGGFAFCRSSPPASQGDDWREDCGRRNLSQPGEEAVDFLLLAGVEGLDLTHVLFSEAADFPFEVFILKFGVVVAADIRVIEGVVVEARQRGFVSGVWTQELPRITGSVCSLGSGWRDLPGVEALLLGTTDGESTDTGLWVGGNLEAPDGSGRLGRGAG